MGVSLEQLTNALDITKEFTKGNIDEAILELRGIVQALYDLGTKEPEGPYKLLDENVGLQDSPVGMVISYMGTVAPNHYLACDGSTYDITTYPDLATHFKKQFGAINHFGGDGVTTFGIPDLRGEFLRGTGTATRNTGSGEEVGVHQDPTNHLNLRIGKSSELWIQSKNSHAATNMDTETETDGGLSRIVFNNDVTSNNQARKSAFYTARPTNTSILYCIKAERTYYIRTGPSNNYYDGEERQVGTLFGTTPVYQKTIYASPVTFGNSSSVRYDMGIKDFDKLINLSGSIQLTANCWVPLIYPDPVYYTNGSTINVESDSSTTWLIIVGGTGRRSAGYKQLLATIQYTKTS